MGFQDREYFRDDEPPSGVKLGPPQMIVTKLVIINVVIYLINALTKDAWLNQWMHLESSWFFQPYKAYQLLTYGFAHAPFGSQSGILHILGNMFVLWMLGREVEWKYGPKEFLRLYLIAIVFCGLLWSIGTHLVGMPGSVIGASGAVVAVVILFALNFPRRSLFLFGIIEMPAWLLGVLWVAMDLVGSFGIGSSRTAYGAHLAGVLFALIYFKLNLNFGNWVPANFSVAKLKPRPKLRIHNPGGTPEHLAEKADRILEKVHREGETSLTSKERKILEEYSRSMREKRK